MKHYHLLSLGSAVVDKIIKVEDSFLKTFRLEKGATRSLVNCDHTPLIDASNQIPIYQPGGSAANTTRVIAGLGLNCAMIAKIGQDKWGEFYRESLKKKNIDPYLCISIENETGQILSLVSPDGERTMCPILGACMDITPHDIKPEWFDTTNLFYLDAYNFYYPEMIRFALESAMTRNCKIAMDITSHEIIKDYKDLILEFIKKGAFSLIFSNAREAYELTGEKDPESAAKILGQYCPLVTIMQGKKGALCYSQEKLYSSLAQKVEAIDTTGAGDIFIGGFLFGYLSDQPLQKCLDIGNKTAAQGVQHFGGELPPETLKRLKSDILNNLDPKLSFAS